MKSIHISTTGFFCFLFILSGCGGASAPAEQDSSKPIANEVVLSRAQFDKAGIASEPMQERKMSGTIKVNGSIDVPPQNMVSVSMPLGGFLRSTKLLPGMHLHKGELIAEMEDPLYIQLQQDYLSAQANLEYLEKEYQRQEELNKSKSGSDKMLEQSKAAYLTREIELSALSEKLRLLGLDPLKINENSISRIVPVRSPIDGYVSRVLVNVGKYVNPSDVLFELVNPDDIHLNLTVFEKDISKLRLGQQVFAFSNANPDKKYPCEIILIGQDVSRDRHIEVHCHFERYDRSLIPGMYMNAEIQTGGLSVQTLPESAIQAYQGKDYVFVESGPLHYTMVEVICGMREEGIVEILNPELIGKRSVVSRGAYALLMKLKNSEE